MSDTPRLRAPSGPTLPATCTPGPPQADQFIKTGSNHGLYICTAPNVWELQANAATGGVTSVNGDSSTHQLIAIGSAGSAPNVDSASTPGTTKINVPAASPTVAGIVTTASQEFAGAKTFDNDVSCFATLHGLAVETGNAQTNVTGVDIMSFPNDTGTGTVINRLAKLSNGKAIIPTTSDREGIIGVVKGLAGATGNCQIAVGGVATVATDGAWTIDNYAVVSISVAGKVHDGGNSRPTDVQVIGRFLDTGGSAGFATLLIFTPGIVYGGGGGSGNAEPLGYAAMMIGVSTPNQVVMLLPINDSFTLSFTGSTAIAEVAATAQTDFLVKVNGATKMTIRFAAAGTIASLVGITSVNVTPGDIVKIVGPASPDLTLANCAFNLKGTSSVPASTVVGIADNIIGPTTPNQKILIYVANAPFTLSFTGSTGIAEVAATAQADFGVWVGTATSNGTLKCTFRFAASGTIPSLVSPTSTSIVSGDVIRIIGPATPDLTLANIAFNLKGLT